MERLQNKTSSEVAALIKKLETLIVQDKITEEKLDSLQETLDKIDEGLEEPNYQLYELQSIIYYARNDKTKSLEFIEDALKLNNDVTEYSKFGALLAEIHMERFVRERMTGNQHTNSENSMIQEIEQNKNKIHDDQIKKLQTKYSGKIEGWLALYCLRLIAIPIVLIIDALTIMNTDLSNIASDVRPFFIAALTIDIALTFGSIMVLFLFVNKLGITIIYARTLEFSLALTYFIFGFWLTAINTDYSLVDSSESTKLFVYGIGALLWFAYWFKSKRVIATFVK